MDIQLSDHFTYKRLFRFTIPSIFMMIFTSIYSIVDGIFTSNFAGKEAFAGLNLIMPGIMLFFGRDSGIVFHRLRQGTFFAHKIRIQNLFARLSFVRNEYFRLVVFHCAEQRNRVGFSFGLENTGLSGELYPSSARSSWHGRNLACLPRSGTFLPCNDRRLFFRVQKKV